MSVFVVFIPLQNFPDFDGKDESKKTLSWSFRIRMAKATPPERHCKDNNNKEQLQIICGTILAERRLSVDDHSVKRT